MRHSLHRSAAALAAAALAAGLAPLPAVAATVVRGPQLEDVGPDGATVSFQTDEPVEASIAWGRAGAAARVAVSPAAKRHSLRLGPLEPSAAYEYRVTAGGAAGPTHRFRSAPRQGSPVRFCAMGDPGSGDAAQREIAARLAAIAPELVLLLGDIVYPAGEEEGYGPRFFGPYAALLPSIPFYPALGNHDLYTARGQALLDNFHPPGGDLRWYSFDRGDVHFVALDSAEELAEDGPQARWFAADLAASRQRWRVVFFHHPPRSHGAHGEDEPEGRAMREVFVPLLARAGGGVTLAGHDHDYERLAPADGVHFFVTGGGGIALRPVKPGPGTVAWDDRHHHVTCFTSDGAGALSFAAVAADGKVLDAGRLRAGGAAGARPGITMSPARPGGR